MNAPKGDTIYALSSGRLPAAIAVVRMSGPRARIGLETLAGKLPEPRRAAYAAIKNPQTGEMIDDAIAIWIPGPKSETGEDMAEIHLHGGRALVAAVFQVLANIDGFRPAGAGEFTRRSLLNGKIDLTGVEALGDLIAAETEAQRRQAMHQFRGALAKKANEWRERLLDALALMEASIDFSDEGDVPQNLQTTATAAIREIASEMDAALVDANRGEKLREGFVVAIAGPANAGKSTLLNALARRDVAIVTDIPGTTRDPIEVSLDLKGVPVVLVDTAGIRATTDPIEAEGIRRALARAHEADLVLWLVEAEDRYPPEAPNPPARDDSYPPEPNPVRVFTVRTKVDRISKDTRAESALATPTALWISAHSGEGIEALIDLLAREAETLAGDPALVTRERQRHAIEQAVILLKLPLGLPDSEELIAEHIRLAAHEMGRITGRVDVEEVLDRIFKNFCIGK